MGQAVCSITSGGVTMDSAGETCTIPDGTYVGVSKSDLMSLINTEI